MGKMTFKDALIPFLIGFAVVVPILLNTHELKKGKDSIFGFFSSPAEERVMYKASLQFKSGLIMPAGALVSNQEENPILLFVQKHDSKPGDPVMVYSLIKCGVVRVEELQKKAMDS